MSFIFFLKKHFLQKKFIFFCKKTVAQKNSFCLIAESGTFFIRRNLVKELRFAAVSK